MELIPFDINADFEKWDVVYRNGNRPFDWHFFRHWNNEFAILSIENKNSDGYKSHNRNGWLVFGCNNSPYDLFLTPKVKKQYQNQYEEGSPGFWHNSIDELKKAQSPQVNVIGIIERTLSVDNKLIDAKIFEG